MGRSVIYPFIYYSGKFTRYSFGFVLSNWPIRVCNPKSSHDMMSLSMMFSGGRPGFSLARDENSSEKQQFRRSQVMGGYNTVKNNYKSNNLSMLSYQTNPRKPVLTSVSHARCGCRNFKVFGGGGNTRSVLSYQTNSTNSNCHLPIISASGGGDNHRIFKVFSGGGNNEEYKSQPGESFLQTIRDFMLLIVYPGVTLHAAYFIIYDYKRKRLEAKAPELHKKLEASATLLLTLTKARLHCTIDEPEKKAKALKLHEKVEATIKKLLAESNPRV